jgi:putative tryptophan/tyrosine transport system substrate-binding protein
MLRRTLVSLIGSMVVAYPLAAHTQPAERSVRIGFLPLGSPTNAYDQSLVEVLRDGLRNVGLVENRDIVLDVVWVGNEAEFPAAVNALVARGAKLLITAGSSASAAAKHHTSTIPIVFAPVGNPVGIGLVESHSRPAGNATGFTDLLSELGVKYLQFSIELNKPQAPVHYLWHTEWPDGSSRFQATESAARSSGVELRSQGIRDIEEADHVIAAMKKDGALTLVLQPSPFTNRHRNRIIAVAMNHRVGAIMAWPETAKDGALVAYGPSYPDMYLRVGSYVDRILKGAYPGDLPVQDPTKYVLAINLKTAEAVGIAVPQSLLAGADEVIE